MEQLAVEWFINQLEEKGNVSEHTKSRILEFKIDVSDYLDLKRQAKEMEKQNEKNACLLAISQYLYKQAVQESEKNNIAEDKKIHIVSTNVKGEIIKVGENWMVTHDFIDPFGQVPLSLPIHFNSNIVTQLAENLRLYFNIVFENNEYFALI
jgi:hypothetical protein